MAHSPVPHAFLVSQHMWHQRLGHPGSDVLCRLISNNIILCNKEKPPVLCHACQLGKHVKLPFANYTLLLIPCDHGGEFDNRTLHKLFTDNGIQYRFSSPKTSQRNGKSERMDIPDINPSPPIVHSLSLTHDSPTATTSPLPTVAPNTPINTSFQHIPSPMAQSSPITHDPTPEAHFPVVAHTPPGSTSFTDTPTPIPFYLLQIINDPPINPNPPWFTLWSHVFVSGLTDPLSILILLVSSVSPLPKSYRDAFDDLNWQHAMYDEYNALIKNKTWTLKPRPRDTNIVRCMWLFRHKYLADGSLSRYTTRLVVNGSTQIEGVDVDETFSPVVKPGTIRTVLSLAASRHWSIHQLDVKNAFLHGDLFETVYMHQPLGFRDSKHPDYVCLLQRSLYGLKQAPRAWFQRFATYVTRVGFHHSRCDTSLFIYRQGMDTAYLLLYVDDIDSLGMFLSQKKYAVEILKRAGMVKCNPSRTPVDTESKLGDTGVVVSDPTLYQSLVGSLQYLTFTRLDISYAVQHVCLHMHDPREPHFSALKWILHYICDTLDYGLQLFSSSTTDLVAYSDADWAGYPTTRRSTLGYSVFLGNKALLGNNLLSWSSKRQPTLSRSSAEAKYHGVANVVAETCWLRNLLRELHTPLSSATLVYCDNVSAVYLSCNPDQHQRTKHIEIDIHFVRDLVAAGQVRVLHVPSRYQFADIFTKGLLSSLFEEFRSSLSVRCPPAPTAKEC
ncbi:ribonuclease H-like domain-containing protein [Tanacetum coccineum]